MGYRIRRRVGRARWKFIEFGMQGQSMRHGACTPGLEASPLHTPTMCSIKSYKSQRMLSTPF